MKYIYITTVLILTISWTQVYSQCYPDRHSTNWFDAWISCETTSNPNTAYGNTHWIQYDFGALYTLYHSKIWNVNNPDHTDYGMQNYNVDYSLDGVSWTNLGSFTLARATGSSIYEGDSGPDFEGIQARYVLITPTSNYGGSCYGFSEIKIYLDEFASVEDDHLDDGFILHAYPNPFTDSIHLQLINNSNVKSISYLLYDLLGREIRSGLLLNNKQNYSINLSNLNSGMYYLKVSMGEDSETLKIIKE